MVNTMRRRAALSWLATCGWLAACGGGGGPGVADAPTAVGGPPVGVEGAELRRDVAVWGDSLTDGMAGLLAPLLGGRAVYNGGVRGETSTQIAARQGGAEGRSRADWVSIFWYGHNNQTESERIVDDVAASVARLAPGNGRFLVLSLVNQATPREALGGEDYDSILRTNRALQDRWPGHFLDIRGFLVGQADRSRWDDERDARRDVPPASLRYDEIHLNQDGSRRVAVRLRDELAARGW
jgi:lysophospholipase L1-like esterase